MPELLLINPPSPFLIDAKCEPPLGLLYLAGAVERVCPVSVIDLGGMQFSKELLEKELKPALKGCKVCGITAVTPQIGYAEQISDYIRHADRSIKIVVGGPHATAVNGDVWNKRKNSFDIAVIGEGETTLAELLEAILKGKDTSKVAGTAHPGADGQAVRAACRPLIPVENIGFPSREHLKVKEYSRHVAGRSATTVITSRGCPYVCQYCMKGTWGSGIRRQPVDKVIGEIKGIKQKYGFEAILFVDDNFTLNKEWITDFCNKMIPLNMKWRCWTRVHLVDQELLHLMKKAGCEEISFGIESGSQKLLDIVHKNVKVQQNIDALTWAKKAGILAKAFLMVGIPGETKETVEETKKFIERADPDQWILSTFIPIVGSPMWNDPEKFGILNFDKHDFEHQWEVGLKGRGGLFIDTKWLSGKELMELHGDLLSFLQKRGK